MAAIEEEEKANVLGCASDECEIKRLLLQYIEAGDEPPPDLWSPGQPLPRAAELREQLEAFAHIAAQAPQDGSALGDRLAIRKPNPKRPWLSYDPDALFPNPYDAFLLGGGCPRIVWPSTASIKERSKLTLDVSLYYIVGCRRTGMTVIAELMSRYAGVVFVNEPRQLWIPLLPAMDIWSVAADSRQGRLYFAPEEASLPVADSGGNTVADVLRDAYTNIAEPATSPSMLPGQSSREVLVIEKFPEHAFRMPFLADLCSQELGPNRCSFLHIIRDGVDTARSIAAVTDAAAWYGVKGERKWKCLREVALGGADGTDGSDGSGEGGSPEQPLGHCRLDLGDEFLAFLDLPRSDERCRFARGLVEWGASIIAARHGAKHAKDATCLEVRYDDLMSNPAVALVGILNHLDLEPSAAARQCARQTLAVKASRPLNSAEREVLMAVRGSQVERLLREFGRELP